jgi:hypothetical protein
MNDRIFLTNVGWCMQNVCQTLMDRLFPRWRRNSYHTQVQPPVYCLQMCIGEELMRGGHGKPSKVYFFLNKHKRGTCEAVLWP